MSSIWNRIGDVATTTAKNAFKFGGEIVGSVGGAARFAWDVGTAPWNDAEEYNGFIQPFKTAAAKEGGDIVKPLASAGGAIMKVPGVQPALERINHINQEYIREPLATYNLVLGDVYAGRASFFDPNEWRKAYKGAQEISLGQALVGSYRSGFDPKFNIYDPREREKAFEKSAWGKFASGGTDLIGLFFGDVTLAAGKAGKIVKASELGVGKLKNADAVAKAAEDITKAQYGVNNRFTKVIDDFTNNDSAYAISHPMVKSSTQPGLLAHLLGDAVDRDETALILRSALGDQVAMDELRLQREYITAALETARGDLSAVDEYRIFSAPDGTGMIPFLNDNPAVIEEARKNYESLVANDRYFAKLMTLGEGGGALTRTTGTLLQGAEDFVAKSRAVRFYDKTVGNPRVEIYQPTPFHRLYQKISWGLGERPAGVVDFNDADSYREIIATINVLERTANYTPLQSKKLLDSYIAARTPEERFTATLNIENQAFRDIAAKYGIDEKRANDIYNNYRGARTSALKSIQDKGFMVDTDGSIIKVPILESQTADYLPIMDFQLMDNLLKREASTIKLLSGKASDVVLNYTDLLQDAFKAGALLRLGYTQRNAIDSQLRIAASVGAMTSLRHLGPGVKHLMNNTLQTPSRIIDRYRKVDAGMTMKQVQQATTSLVRELKDLKTQIAEAEAKLSLKPNDVDLLGEVNTLKLLQEEKMAVYQHNIDVINSRKELKVISDEEEIKRLNPNLNFNPNVGLVNTNFVKDFIEFDRTLPDGALPTSKKTISDIAKDLKDGKGFTDPLKLAYDVDVNGNLFLKLTEGNHRIQAALQVGIDKIPVQMVRNTGGLSGFKSVNFVPKIKLNKSGVIPKNINPNKVLPETALFLKQKVSKFNLKPNERIGTGSYSVTTSDGQTYVLHDAFGGPFGEMFRRIASSGNSFERMVDSNANMYSAKLSSKGIAQVTPDMPGYFEQWAQTLRQQFGNSAVINKLVAGESVEDITRWLRNSPEGRDLRKRLAIRSDESGEYVTKLNGFLDTYLPVSSGLRSKIKDITASDLRSAFKDPTDLPIIHGHVLEENINNAGQIAIRNVINSMFRFLGTLPEDAWARNPLYIQLYRTEARRRLEAMSGATHITKEQQLEIMAQSHKVALREMKGILFNIERKSNLAAAMKYISPFFSAQENAYKTWLKLAVANPAIINRGYQVWQSPNKAGLVLDSEGNEVPAGQTTGNDTIWIGLPKGITKIPGFESLTQLGIPKGSLDIIFQGGLDVLYNKGNPNVFSDIFPVGPYVGVPVSEIVRRQPSLEESFRWALPFGPSKDAVSGFLPTWFKKLQTRLGEQEDPQFARTYQLIWNTEQMKAKRDGLPPVNPNKILDMTKQYWNMRTAASLIAPFAPRFDSPYAFYINKSREYKRIYGLQADEKFLQDYPDFFSFTSSLSSNPTNVQSSVQAVNNIKKYSDLVGELNTIEPKLIGLIVNDFSGYEFSQAAYDYLYSKKISPGSSQKFLSSQAPEESQKRNEAEKGWIQYNQLSDAIDNELKARGLTSIQQKGAEDIKTVKEAFIANLAIAKDAEGKPIYDKKTGQYQRTAWYDDYLDSDGSKTNRVIAGLGKILKPGTKFEQDNADNPTWKSVAAYLEFRKVMAQELAKREAKSIDAKTNTDIRFVYDGFVNKLKKDDPLGFAYLYDRFLSQDLVYEKYLTPKEPK